MATVEQEEITIRVDARVLAGLRQIAQNGGREFDAVAEEAFRQYAKSNANGLAEDDDEVMAHFWDSVKRNYRLGELLAQ